MKISKEEHQLEYQATLQKGLDKYLEDTKEELKGLPVTKVLSRIYEKVVLPLVTLMATEISKSIPGKSPLGFQVPAAQAVYDKNTKKYILRVTFIDYSKEDALLK